MDTQLPHPPNMEAILSVKNLISLLFSEKQSEGESIFEAMKEQDPNSLALHLSQLVGDSNSHDLNFRGKCAKLLHRLLTDDNCHIWNNNLSASTQSTLKSILLIRIKNATFEDYSMFIIHTLCSTVSELCNLVINWPELLPFLHEAVASNSNRLKESFLFIFAYLDREICRTLFPDIMSLHPILLNTLTDYTLNLYTRIAALIAATNFIQCLSGLNEVQRVQSLLPAMMKTLTDALGECDWDFAVQYMLDRYIKLAKNEPRFFRTQIVDVVNTMFEIVEDVNMNERTRHLAFHFLLTLVEAREKAPGMMKKLPRFTHTFFALLLNLLLDIEDDPSWHSVEDFSDVAGLTDGYRFGVNWLKRFSIALGGKTVAPIAIEQLTPYLVSPEWVKRHAALDALVHIVEGCSKAMIKYLKRVVSMVLRSFQDSHPQVRWAAISSVAQMLLVLCPDLQEQHHNQVVPALVVAMDDFQNPRVQNHNQMVQQKALDALGAVADMSEGHFQRYYDVVMPYLKTILVNKNDKFNHMLRSKALNCMSLVGMAVGKEKFRDDVNQAMEVLKSSQELQDKDFDSIFYVLRACERICRCMGKDFLPYMSTVMPLLVKCVQLETNITDKFNDELLLLSMHKVKFGDEMIYAKGRDFLKVKSLACNVYAFYAQTLKEDFYPWISETTSVLVPLLKFYIHNDVRGYASNDVAIGGGEAMVQLLNSAKLAVEKGIPRGENEYFKHLSYEIILAFGDALYTEPDTKVCASILYGLGDCLLLCGPLLREDLLRSIMDVINNVITESSRRKWELTEREKAEDFDAEEAELMSNEIEDEEEVTRIVGGILRRLVETFKVDFLPFFDELSSYLMPMRGKDKTPAESLTSNLVFCEVVEQCGEAALKYYNTYLPFLLKSSNDENPDVRQSALYGLRLCAEHGVSVFKPFVGEALPKINKVMMHLHARDPKNEHAYDNAIFALGKIFQFHKESINSAQILLAWLNCLPIKVDMDEARDVHDQLCLIVERLDMDLLGPEYKHFPKIISVFAEILCAGKDVAREETLNRMIYVLRNLQKIIPPDTWATAWSLLLPQQEMELEFVLSHEEDANFSSG